MLPYSILDFQHPGATVALATSADAWGYRRFWLGEHHGPNQCPNPILLGGLLAGATPRIRIGSGGMNLTYSTPYRIAEDARLLEFLLPGRFDLGVTRGLRLEGPVEEALLDGRPGPRDDYHARLAFVHGLVTGRLPADHPLRAEAPYLDPGPPIWTLGLRPPSAVFAGRYGTGFCFSVHHAADGIDARKVIRTYLDEFIPSPEFPEPQVIVVIRCVCAASTAEAEELARIATPSPLPCSTTIVGSPEQCVDRCYAIASRLHADEVMLLDFLQTEQDRRLEMYELIAAAAGLSSRLG